MPNALSYLLVSLDVLTLSRREREKGEQSQKMHDDMMTHALRYLARVVHVSHIERGTEMREMTYFYRLSCIFRLIFRIQEILTSTRYLQASCCPNTIVPVKLAKTNRNKLIYPISISNKEESN